MGKCQGVVIGHIEEDAQNYITKSCFCLFFEGCKKMSIKSTLYYKLYNRIVFSLVICFNTPVCLFFLYTLHIVNHNHHQTPPRFTRPKHHITTFHHVMAASIIKAITIPTTSLHDQTSYTNRSICHSLPLCNKEDSRCGTNGG